MRLCPARVKPGFTVIYTANLAWITSSPAEVKSGLIVVHIPSLAAIYGARIRAFP